MDWMDAINLAFSQTEPHPTSTSWIHRTHAWSWKEWMSPGVRAIETEYPKVHQCSQINGLKEINQPKIKISKSPRSSVTPQEI
jgi:uridine phosphorylase